MSALSDVPEVPGVPELLRGPASPNTFICRPRSVRKARKKVLWQAQLRGLSGISGTSGTDPPTRGRLQHLPARQPEDAAEEPRTTAHTPNIERIDDGIRSHTAWLVTNWEVVSAWLSGRGDSKRLLLRHPRAIRRSYDAAHAVTPPDGQGQEPAARTRPATQQVEVLDIVRTLRGGGLFPVGTSMAHVADTLEAGLSYDWLKRLHPEIGKRLANAERQDAIEAKRGRARR